MQSYMATGTSDAKTFSRAVSHNTVYFAFEMCS